MLQTAYIKEHKEEAIAGLKKRNFPDPEKQIDGVLDLDRKRKKAQGELDQILAESNRISKQIGQLMQTGKREEAEEVKRQTGLLKTKGKELQEIFNELSSQLRELLYQIPNIPHKSVPEGVKESDNLTIKEVGGLPHLPAGHKPHWELIKEYDLIDFELGNKVTGAGFPFYKGYGARLQRALVNYFLDRGSAAGYTEIQPPVLVNETSGLATGQLPDKEGQMYPISGEPYYLIPTAEVPLTNIYRDVTLKEGQLPIKMMGYTPCFRREAGSWGAHVRGLNRLHQFDKVEIVRIEDPEHSYQALEDMLSHVEVLLQQLELPYRILNLCAGDLGFTSALTYDFEVFSASQERWLEVSSVSNFETFQANRLKLKHKDKTGKTELVHTLNGSALALPRILAALLENNQSEGHITIPKSLVPYTGFNKISLPS
ncbi:MAG: serine--tRNA ligase [Cyclobacteriaceae bacterium]